MRDRLGVSSTGGVVGGVFMTVGGAVRKQWLWRTPLLSPLAAADQASRTRRVAGGYLPEGWAEADGCAAAWAAENALPIHAAVTRAARMAAANRPQRGGWAAVSCSRCEVGGGSWAAVGPGDSPKVLREKIMLSTITA